MAFVIKAELPDPRARRLEFSAQKTRYGGKFIAAGDTLFVFASETQGGRGLFARAVVISAKTVPPGHEIVRQTPRVSIVVRRTALARRALGRAELKRFCAWTDGRPETELNFKFYRQATNKIARVSAAAAAFLERYF
ncbi:MAG: hypothetical protein ACYCT1_09735 [Steroidobacteraceae bacterium]